MTKIFPWSKLGYRKTCVVTSPCTFSAASCEEPQKYTHWLTTTVIEVWRGNVARETPLQMHPCRRLWLVGRKCHQVYVLTEDTDLIFPNMMVFPLKTTSGTQDNRFFQLLSWSWLLCLTISPCPLTNCRVNWWSRVQILYGNSKLSTVQ